MENRPNRLSVYKNRKTIRNARKIAVLLAKRDLDYKAKIIFEIQEDFGWVFYITHAFTTKYYTLSPRGGTTIVIVDFHDLTVLTHKIFNVL
ncbi:MAG: hypothetical protein GY810_13820 [Aureispira sp.]|nr:hypothetical protein [Aureispira sp.]